MKVNDLTNKHKPFKPIAILFYNALSFRLIENTFPYTIETLHKHSYRNTKRAQYYINLRFRLYSFHWKDSQSSDINFFFVPPSPWGEKQPARNVCRINIMEIINFLIRNIRILSQAPPEGIFASEFFFRATAKKKHCKNRCDNAMTSGFFPRKSFTPSKKKYLFGIHNLVLACRQLWPDEKNKFFSSILFKTFYTMIYYRLNDLFWVQRRRW